MQYLRGYQNYYNKISDFNPQDIGLFTFYQQQHQQTQLIKSRRNIKIDLKNQHSCKLPTINKQTSQQKYQGKLKTTRRSTVLTRQKIQKLHSQQSNKSDLRSSQKKTRAYPIFNDIIPQSKEIKQQFTPRLKKFFFSNINNEQQKGQDFNQQIILYQIPYHNKLPCHNKKIKQNKSFKQKRKQHSFKIQQKIQNMLINFHNSKKNQQKINIKQFNKVINNKNKRIKFIMISNKQQQQINSNKQIILTKIIQKYISKSP